jgi:hypothetical protein
MMTARAAAWLPTTAQLTAARGGIMLERKSKRQVIAKLMVARDEIEAALNVSVPAARYDPVLVPQAARNELSVLRDDLDRIIGKLKGEP